MQRITSIDLRGDYRIHLTFSDGFSGMVDFSKFVGKGVFQKWSDKAQFEKVHIGEYGELIWDDEIDFCPDALYLEVTGKSVEEIYPNLNPQHA